MSTQKTFNFKELRISGLSVVELLIAVSAVLLILALSTPVITSLVQDHYLKKTSVELAASLDLAQKEAARRHSTARICPSSDGVTCRQDGDWSLGWLVFTDGNGNGRPEKIEILQSYGPLNEKIRVEASGAITDVASFTIAGLSSANDSNAGSFNICHANPDAGSRTLKVDQQGWVEVVKSDQPCRKG